MVLVFKLTTAYVEHIHDKLVPSVMAFDEPVDPHAFKDMGLLDSAVNRAFATFGGRDLYTGVYQKAAALFHSLTCNHCFYNGNKRTAVMSLDLFLSANSIVLAASNEEIYKLAKETAAGNQSGKKADYILSNIHDRIVENAVPFEEVKAQVALVPELQAICDQLEKASAQVRSHPLNISG